MNTGELSIKKKLFGDMALIGRAVGHPVRLELLDLLAQGERTVEVLAGKCGQTVGNTSQHLRILFQAGLVEKRRDGNFVAYRNADATQSILDCVTRTAVQTLPAVRQVVQAYFEKPDELTNRPARELLRLARSGSIVLLDVRPEDEYAAGHIRGAVSLPLAELKKNLARLAKLSGKREIVAYCRGPYCVLSVEAVALLRAHGLQARRLRDGYPQWKRRSATAREVR